MEAVAGAVLGPRPGKAICSFWQGTVEILLRIIALVFGSLPALIAAAVALGEYNTAEAGDLIDGSGSGQDSGEVEELTRNVRGSSGFVIAITSLAILLMVFLIVLRICNIGLINIKINIFLAIAVVLGVLLLIGHLAGGVVCALYAADISPSVVLNGLAASAVFCFLSVFLYGFMVIWDIIFMVKEWNTKVVKYTLKEAVTG